MTVSLHIGGRQHVGWTEATVTRSLDTISGAFTVSLSERDPGETRPRFIRPGDDCRVSLEGDTVISGWVDAVTVDYSATSHTIAVRGRDATGDLVDCSAATEPGEWHNERLGAHCRRPVRAFRYRRHDRDQHRRTVRPLQD